MKTRQTMAVAVVGIMIASGFLILVPSQTAAMNRVIHLTPEPTNPNRVPNQGWENGFVMEQSDFQTGANSYISWFRGNIGLANASQIGYATSTNGITWTPYAGNPILPAHNWAFPYVVHVDSRYYMFIKNNTNGNLFMFNVTLNHTSPQIMNSGNPVYYHNTTSAAWDYDIYNPSVVIVNGTWHMLLEGKDNVGGGFQIGYTYSTFAEHNWTLHRKPYAMIPRSGNPYLTYVPQRGALLALYGNMTGPGEPGWTTRAAYAYMNTDYSEIANWVIVPAWSFSITNPSFSVCDPSMTTFGTNELMISYSWNQSYDNSYIAQSYTDGPLLKFFDTIAGIPPVSMLPANVHQYVVLIVVMFSLVLVMPVIGLAQVSKDKGISKENVIELVVFEVVGLVLLGFLVVFLGAA